MEKRDKMSDVAIMEHLFQVLMDINYHRDPIEFIPEIDENDPFINKHLNKYKRTRAKLKAKHNKKSYEDLAEKFLNLKKYGLSKLQEILTTEEKVELQPLFRKFEELDETDKSAILDDRDFLTFISKMDKKINDDSE